MKSQIKKKSLGTVSKLNITLKAHINAKANKVVIRGIKNGKDFKKHLKVIKKSLKNQNLKTRSLRVGSPKTLTLPISISSTTYKTVRYQDLNFSIGNKLPQVMKQVYNNDLILKSGVIYGFEKKKSKVKNSSEVDFAKADITIKLIGNSIELVNYINNKKGKIYKMKFSSKSSSSTWFNEVRGVGLYSMVSQYKKV